MTETRSRAHQVGGKAMQLCTLVNNIKETLSHLATRAPPIGSSQSINDVTAARSCFNKHKDTRQ